MRIALAKPFIILNTITEIVQRSLVFKKKKFLLQIMCENFILEIFSRYKSNFCLYNYVKAPLKWNDTPQNVVNIS